MRRFKDSVTAERTIGLFCAIALLVFPAQAYSTFIGNQCIWSFPSAQIPVPNGYCVSDAILTLRDVSFFDNNASRLSIYLLHDKTNGFYGLTGNDIPEDFIASHGIILGEVEPNNVTSGNIQIRLSQFMDTVSDNPRLDTSLPFQFTDGKQTTLSAAILQFMDYLGTGSSTAFGFHSKGFSFDSISLTVISRPYAVEGGSKAFFITSGNLNPPLLNPISDRTVFEGQEINFTLEANDADDTSLFYYGQDMPEGAVLSQNHFTWTPSWKQAGIYRPRFIISDGKNSNAIDVCLTVLDFNQPPVVSPIAIQSGQEHKLLIFPVAAVDPQGDPVKITALNLPSGAVFRSNYFYWIPTAGQAGTYEPVFIASDGLLESEQAVVIVINPSSTVQNPYSL